MLLLRELGLVALGFAGGMAVTANKWQGEEGCGGPLGGTLGDTRPIGREVGSLLWWQGAFHRAKDPLFRDFWRKYTGGMDDDGIHHVLLSSNRPRWFFEYTQVRRADGSGSPRYKAPDGYYAALVRYIQGRVAAYESQQQGLRALDFGN